MQQFLTALFNWIKQYLMSTVKAPPATSTPSVPPSKVPTKFVVDPKDKTPWMTWLNQYRGWDEVTHDKELSAFWKYTNVPNYTSVIGSKNAWCAMMANAALIETGFKGTGDAGAISFAKYGTECELVPGAVVVIEHADGSHHVTFFESWANEDKWLCNCLNGNQSNKVKTTVFDFSDSSDDELLAARWPVEATK